MITLDIKPYCHECRDFEPVCEQKCYTYMNKDLDGVKTADTVIYCKTRNRCENIRRYISRQKEAIGSEEYDDGK